jgi:hypothetical protein
MALQGLLDESEATAAEIGIIHTDVVSFKVGPLAIEVMRERFQAQTEDATAFEALRDLIVGAFGRLSHTPIAAIGINRSTHHEMPSVSAWNEIGHRLLPKQPWEGVLEHPGTRSLTVEGRRPDSHEGYIRATFEPSNVVANGVFQLVNDHLQLNRGDAAHNIPASEAMTVLGEVWSDSLARAQRIVDHVLMPP